MAEKWQELDALIAAARSANQSGGTRQSGAQRWVGFGGSEKGGTEIDEYYRAEIAKAARAVKVFLATNGGTDLKPPLLSRGKLQTPWNIFKTYLR